MSAKAFQGHRWNSRSKLSPRCCCCCCSIFFGPNIADKTGCVFLCACARAAAISSAKLTESPASFPRLMASHLAGLSGSAVIISVASVHTGTAQQRKGPVYAPQINTRAAFGQFPQLLCLTMDVLANNLLANLNICGLFLLPRNPVCLIFTCRVVITHHAVGAFQID